MKRREPAPTLRLRSSSPMIGGERGAGPRLHQRTRVDPNFPVCSKIVRCGPSVDPELHAGAEYREHRALDAGDVIRDRCLVGNHAEDETMALKLL